MAIKMIVAMNGQAVIGKDNKIPWFYKGDLKYFKEQTTGHVVIMGRKTWESLPPKMRPLPNRMNIVLTSKPQDVISNLEPGNTLGVSASLREAIEFATSKYPEKDIWLIGGAAVYKEGMQYADTCLVSLVPDTLDDLTDVVYAPKFGDDWGMAKFETHPYEPIGLATWERRRQEVDK